MLTKESINSIRHFYRTILKISRKNGEKINLGSNVSTINLKNYKIFEWDCSNKNFPKFYSGSSHGKYNSLRETFRLVAKETPDKYDLVNLKLITIGIKHNFYNINKLN